MVQRRRAARTGTVVSNFSAPDARSRGVDHTSHAAPVRPAQTQVAGQADPHDLDALVDKRRLSVSVLRSQFLRGHGLEPRDWFMETEAVGALTYGMSMIRLTHACRLFGT